MTWTSSWESYPRTPTACDVSFHCWPTGLLLFVLSVFKILTLWPLKSVSVDLRNQPSFWFLPLAFWIWLCVETNRSRQRGELIHAAGRSFSSSPSHFSRSSLILARCQSGKEWIIGDPRLIYYALGEDPLKKLFTQPQHQGGVALWLTGSYGGFVNRTWAPPPSWRAVTDSG